MLPLELLLLLLLAARTNRQIAAKLSTLKRSHGVGFT
jgi:hypothetical protein